MGDRIKEEAFIIYLNDDNRQVSAYVKIIELNSGFIQFETNSKNVITIPITRIIKIKEKSE